MSTAQQRLDECINAPEDVACQVAKLVIGLKSGEYSQQKVAQKVIVEGEEVKQDTEQKDEYYQDGIRPAIFKTLIGKGHQEFSTGQQQDVRQYFSYLLEKMFISEKQ